MQRHAETILRAPGETWWEELEDTNPPIEAHFKAPSYADHVRWSNAQQGEEGEPVDIEKRMQSTIKAVCTELRQNGRTVPASADAAASSRCIKQLYSRCLLFFVDEINIENDGEPPKDEDGNPIETTQEVAEKNS